MMLKDYILEKLQSGPLFKHWERDYSIFFLSASGPGHQLGNSKRLGDKTLTLALFVYQDGVSAYYRLKYDNEKFLQLVGEKLKKSAAMQKHVFDRYAFFGKSILKMFKEIESKKQFSPAFVKTFAKNYSQLTAYQLIMHRVIDYVARFPEHASLAQRLIQERTRYEPVFGLFEKYFDILCRKIARQQGLKEYSLLKLLTVEEFLSFLKNKKLPRNLALRKKLAIVTVLPTTELITGKLAQNLLKEIKVNLVQEEMPLTKEKVIRGQPVGRQGMLRGVIQVITDYTKLISLRSGYILVTPSTLPKYNHIYQRAKAIITNEGGLLSHVAIFCREFKIPGIIGTKIATKVLKDGDLVEVDADKGIVRKIS